MKKTIKFLFCFVFLIALTLSMTACDNNGDLLAKIDDLQAQVEQQGEQLEKQDDKLKRQNDKISELQDTVAELEEKNKKLEEKNKKLEESMNKLANSIPYEIGVIGTSNNILWHLVEGQSLLVSSRAELEDWADQLENYSLFADLTMNYDGGTLDKELLLEWYDDSYFEKKAAIGCVFLTQNNLSQIKNVLVWNDDGVLQIEIDYTQTYSTSVEWVMVILEIDRQYVRDIEEIHFVTNEV